MSGIRSHDSPAHQSITHEIYDNHGLHINTSEGTVNSSFNTTSYQTIISNPRPSDPLHELHQRCSPSAAFDSRARFDPPRCTESTRLGIIRRIEEWINNDRPDGVQASIFWLYGGAGAGKSALAQSLSESFQAKKELAASFFFFRSDASRNSGDQLIPTLVSQLVNTFKGLDWFVRERIRTTPDLFTKKYQVQIQGLLVEPLCGLKSQKAVFLPQHIIEQVPSMVTRDVQGSWPRLVVIDGLDECESPDVQGELLRVIARAIPNNPYPLRFLITSRPESHITRVFDHDRDLQAAITHRYNLSDDPSADADIWKFLKTEFKEICCVHPLGKYLPSDWPGQMAIGLLVKRSSRHFIYASTVIRYIRSPKHRPDDRLKVILRLQPPQDQDRPYAQLDALYSFVLQGVESPDQLEKICLVFGILYFRSRKVGFFEATTNSHEGEIEGFLELRAGDLVLLIDPILSLVTINKGGTVQIFHKSLFDYLLDPSRGGHLPFDLARVHEVVATHILKKHVHAHHFPESGHINSFVYHCRFGYLNQTLKDYFYSLDVPGNLLSRTLGSRSRQMFNFLDILSREDFDSTGQYYEQCVAKLASGLNSAIERYPQHSGTIESSGVANSVTISSPQSMSLHLRQNIEHVKGRLDTLLMEWKPRNFHLTNTPSYAFRHVEHEHRLFATLAKASTPSDQFNTLVSSLVLGEHFIHSYHFRFRDGGAIFLILITYSRRSNTGFLKIYTNVDIIGATQVYLMETERFFLSDFYQKYGIEPEGEYT